MHRKCYFYIIRKLADYANDKVLKLFKNKKFKTAEQQTKTYNCI